MMVASEYRGVWIDFLRGMLILWAVDMFMSVWELSKIMPNV